MIEDAKTAHCRLLFVCRTRGLQGSLQRPSAHNGGRKDGQIALQSGSVNASSSGGDIASSTRLENNVLAEKAFMTLHRYRIDELWNTYFATSSKKPLPRLTIKQKTNLLMEYSGRESQMYTFLESRLAAEISKRGGADRISGLHHAKCSKCASLVGVNECDHRLHHQLVHYHSLWCAYVACITRSLAQRGCLYDKSWVDFVQLKRRKGRLVALIVFALRRGLPGEVNRLIFGFAGHDDIASLRRPHDYFSKTLDDSAAVLRRAGAFSALLTQYQEDTPSKSLLDPGIMIQRKRNDFVIINIGANEHIQKRAVAVFTSISKYMNTSFARNGEGEWPKQSSMHGTQVANLIKWGQDMPRIADEIFMQLMKQLCRCNASTAIVEGMAPYVHGMRVFRALLIWGCRPLEAVFVGGD